MKKIIILLLILFTLVGCERFNTYNSDRDEVSTYDDGDYGDDGDGDYGGNN